MMILHTGNGWGAQKIFLLHVEFAKNNWEAVYHINKAAKHCLKITNSEMRHKIISNAHFTVKNIFS